MPDCEFQLFAPADLAETLGIGAHACFDKVRLLQSVRFRHRPRFESFLMCDFEQAIFLDGDTFCAAPCYELFDVLAHFEVALAPAAQYLHHEAVRKGVYSALPGV